jgi:TonB family protein
MKPRRLKKIPSGLVLAFSLILPAFAQSSDEGAGLYGPPVVTDWTPPVYPPGLKDGAIEGRVQVSLVVDENGVPGKVRATKSTDPRFEAAAVASVEQWKFKPAVADDKPVAMSVGITLLFKLPEPKKPGLLPPPASMPRPLKKTPCKVLSQVEAEFPPALARRGVVSGRVQVELLVGADGGVSDVRILDATQAEFVMPALAAFRRWKFEPARQGDLAVADKVATSISFSALDNLSEATRNRISDIRVNMAEGQRLEQVCERAPECAVGISPVYPHDAAVAGRGGEATVEFTLGSLGTLFDVRVTNASEPAFGRALEAAIRAGKFLPAKKSGVGVTAPMIWTHKFRQPAATPPADPDAESPEMRVIRIVNAGGKIEGARGLDRKLRPIWRQLPVVSEELRKSGGKHTAEIEFVIATDGRACLPRIVNASSEEFGWAAATAVSCWVFDPPTRGGEPANVRVRIPIQL